jgi:hypothetical protein
MIRTSLNCICYTVGKVLARHCSMPENRSDPVIVGFGYEPGPEVGSIEDVKSSLAGGSIDRAYLVRRPVPVYGDQQIVLRIYRPAVNTESVAAPPIHIGFHGGGMS